MSLLKERPMQRFLLLPLALLCLVPVADVLQAREPPTAPNDKELALKKLEVLTKELDALEQRLTEERIEARTKLMEREEVVRSLERRNHLEMQALTTERAKMEEMLKEIESKTTPDAANKIKDEVRKKLTILMIDQEKLAMQAADARKDVMIAEEKFKLLERRHDNQRRLANLKLELVEQELFGKSEGGDRRKQERLEKSLETIQRDLEELRRKLGAKAESSGAPSK
jgi:hypothetical protein